MKKMMKSDLKENSSFPDDCGSWQSDKGTTAKSYYILGHNGQLRIVFKRRGVFCAQFKSCGKKGFTQVNPQPADGSVLEVFRYYSKLKKDLTYQRRITWLGNGVEYLGVFPGLSPHGNSSKSKSLPNEIEEAVEALSQAMQEPNGNEKDIESCKDTVMVNINEHSLKTTVKEKDIGSSEVTVIVGGDETSKEDPVGNILEHPDANGTFNKAFLETNEIFKILTNSKFKDCSDCIPTRAKNNVYFVIRNEKNSDKYCLGNQSSFPDDSGPWCSNKGTISVSYFLTNPDGQKRVVFKRDGIFCFPKRKNKKRVFVAMDPQPSDSSLSVLIQIYSVSKKDNSYKRRVSYFGGGAVPKEEVAVVEYLRIYPRKASFTVHGNANRKRTYAPDRVSTRGK